MRAEWLLAPLEFPSHIGRCPVCPSPPITAMGDRIARIRLHPRFESLQLLLQVSRYLPVVEKKDPEPFPVADAVPKCIGFAGVLGGQIGLAHVPVNESLDPAYAIAN